MHHGESTTNARINSGATTHARINSGATTHARINSGATTNARISSGAITNARIGSSASTRSMNNNNSNAGLSVWDIAVAEARKRRLESQKLDGDKAPREATLLIVGTRSSGKTTLLQRFLDREEPPRNTLALEYTYGRKSGKTLVKDVCHLWELGGGALFTSLLTAPLTAKVMLNLAVVIMLDLSRPETIWTDLEALIASVQQEIKAVVSKEPGLHEQLQAAAWNRVGEDHQDKEIITPFLVPLVILGGKYDIFQDMEPENKKVVCRALRFVAHSHGASLQFFSARDAGLVKKAKELLSHYAFGTNESKSLAQDYNKPLIIPAGSDSFNTISGNINESQVMTLEAWKQTFTVKFPQENQEKSALPEDPARDPNYAEPDVDNLRSQKDEELERIRREVGRSNARWAELELS